MARREPREAGEPRRGANPGSYADLGGPRRGPAADPAADEWYDTGDEPGEHFHDQIHAASDGYGGGHPSGAYADEGGHVDEYGHWVYDDAVPAGRGAHSARARRRSRRRRHPIRTVLLAAVLVLVVVAAVVLVRIQRDISPGGRPGRLVEVTIPSGASTAQIGSILARAGVIHGSGVFRYYVKLKGDGPLLPGTYQLAVNEKYDAVISSLSAGPPLITERLVIPEGFTLQQIAQRVAALKGFNLSAAKFLEAATSGQVRSPYEPRGVDNLEGLIFPATYPIRQGMSEADILQALVDRFDEEAASLNLTQAAAALHMTPYQVITVASIVEREAKLDADRGPVASAIYNRLKAGMALGADSTLVYALRQADPTVNVATIDYNQPNPYNTRLNKGLPPTPISNPGVPSLTAAASPPATTYLYFVETNPDGKLSFASTSAGFAQLQAQCRAANLC